MKNILRSCSRYAVPALALTAGLALSPLSSRAADHGDAPTVDHDSGADLADAFIFLDPNDNTRVVIAMTVHGFIVPGEANNFATFDPKVQFQFQIENTGDAKPDGKIQVRFSEKTLATSNQTATVVGKGFGTKFQFTAPTTASTLAAKPNTQVVTTDDATGIRFFAGEVDDPFFFDLVAFNRFMADFGATGTPHPSFFDRGRDTFAGYNVLCIAMSIPKTLLQGSAPTIGLSTRTRRMTQTPNVVDGGTLLEGSFAVVDRTATPAVNVALIPYGRKDEYNISSPEDDASGRFAGDIIKTLTATGTSQANINLLASLAVTNGDYLRINVNVANTGAQGGTNPEAAFPNGRRPGDDVINTLLTVITNGVITTDHVDSSDVLPQDQFPFFALPHQPQDPGVTDDSTRN